MKCQRVAAAHSGLAFAKCAVVVSFILRKAGKSSIVPCRAPLPFTFAARFAVAIRSILILATAICGINTCASCDKNKQSRDCTAQAGVCVLTAAPQAFITAGLQHKLSQTYAAQTGKCKDLSHSQQTGIGTGQL